MLLVIFISSIVLVNEGCWYYFCPYNNSIKRILVPEGVVGIICALMSLVLLKYFPVPLPGRILVGDFDVGTICTIILTKTAKNEESGSEGTAPVTCQVWYPMHSKTNNAVSITKSIVESISSLFCFSDRCQLWTSGHPEVANDESWYLTKHLSVLYKLPHFLLKHLILARTNSSWTKTLELYLTKKHPVIIYSHGLYGWRQCGQNTCETLASFG